jgi:hypothetical protein
MIRKQHDVESKADPLKARGLMSGILQQGYSMGYVFAACANLGVGGSTESWKTVFGKDESPTMF